MQMINILYKFYEIKQCPALSFETILKGQRFSYFLLKRENKNAFQFSNL